MCLQMHIQRGTFMPQVVKSPAVAETTRVVKLQPTPVLPSPPRLPPVCLHVHTPMWHTCVLGGKVTSGGQHNPNGKFATSVLAVWLYVKACDVL